MINKRTVSSQEELQEILNSLPYGLCIYQIEDNHSIPVFCNQAYCEVMGLSPEYADSLDQEHISIETHPDEAVKLHQDILAALLTKGHISQAYHLWNEKRQEYRWIHAESSVKSDLNNTKSLFCMFSDVSGQKQLDSELAAANSKMQDIINSIPGGVAIFKISDRFEILYISDGVPELTGHTAEEYNELIKQDAASLIYSQDREMAVSMVDEVIRTHKVTVFEFRMLHREGCLVYVRVLVKWIGEENGSPFLHCVFHNISDLRETQIEMEHLIHSIPGGVVSYRVEGDSFIPTSFSDGVPELSGHTRKEFIEIVKNNAFGEIYESDRARVLCQIKEAMESGQLLDISYRIRHKNGSLVWIHLNGKRMGPKSKIMRFYAVYTPISAEAQLFKSVADETADGIYIIDKSNYDLLYANESGTFPSIGTD